MSLAIQTVSTVQPDSPILQRWQDQIRTARAEEKALVITGAGSKSFYGLPIEGEALDTRDYRGIIDYEPTELVMTARCGTPLSEIEATLAASGQMLAFEPPRFGGTPTIGGVVAAGLSGPRRMAAGAVRDFVLGVRPQALHPMRADDALRLAMCVRVAEYLGTETVLAGYLADDNTVALTACLPGRHTPGPGEVLQLGAAAEALHAFLPGSHGSALRY